jgi:quinol monooxygenase YgiN
VEPGKGKEHRMYGTVARLKIKPGALAELDRIGREDTQKIEGAVFEYVFQMDSDPNEVMLVVGFKDKAAYTKNAQSPEQHKRYEQYRALLTADPEWHDGEIVSSFTK